MKRAKNKKKLGRPRGAKGTYAVAGAPIGDNLRRAVFGKYAGEISATNIVIKKSDGAFWADQTWVALNQSAKTRKLIEERIGVDGAEAVLKEGATSQALLLAKEILQRIKNCDRTFFAEFAEGIDKRLSDAPFAHEPNKAAFLAHVQVKLFEAPAHKFTFNELSERVAWVGYQPDERTILRWVRESSVPMQRGRPVVKR